MVVKLRRALLAGFNPSPSGSVTSPSTGRSYEYSIRIGFCRVWALGFDSTGYDLYYKCIWGMLSSLLTYVRSSLNIAM
jgi:hypothetical protein